MSPTRDPDHRAGDERRHARADAKSPPSSRQEIQYHPGERPARSELVCLGAGVQRV